MIDLTLISASKNTPIVIERMLKSFLLYHPKYEILICENSTDDQNQNHNQKKRKKTRKKRQMRIRPLASIATKTSTVSIISGEFKATRL